MAEKPTPPEVSRQETINGSVKSLYERLVALSRIADAQVPNEAGERFTSFKVSFVDGTVCYFSRHQDQPGDQEKYPNIYANIPHYKGPRFELEVRMTLLDRSICFLRKERIPRSSTLHIDYPEDSSTPKAYFRWPRKTTKMSTPNEIYGPQPAETSLDSTERAFPITLIQKTLTRLSKDVKKIRDATEVDEEELPEWARDIRTPTMAYRQVMNEADKVLGIYPTRMGMGSIAQEFRQKYADLFYEFIARHHSILPEVIQYEGASHQSLRLETNIGPIIHQAISEDLYLFPKHMAILHLDSLFAPFESKYIPGSADFIGIEALLNQERSPGVDVAKLKTIYEVRYSSGYTIREPNTHDWRFGGLENRQVKIVLKQMDKFLQNPQARTPFDGLLGDIQTLERQTEQGYQEARNHWAEQIRTRVLNIVDTYSRYPGLYRLIPDYVQAGTLQRDEEQVDRKRILLFLQKADRKLVRVHDTSKAAEKPNFTNATDAELTDWLDALAVVSNLSIVLPSDIRKQVDRSIA